MGEEYSGVINLVNQCPSNSALKETNTTDTVPKGPEAAPPSATNPSGSGVLANEALRLGHRLGTSHTIRRW